MGGPVDLVIATVVALATAYCLARCLVPHWRHGHGLAVDAWHAAMGAAMVAMLLAPVAGWSATIQTAVFALGALWCACHLLARNRSAAHARLGAACAVMAAMLVPAMLMAPASADAPAEGHHHHHTPGMDMSAYAAPSAHHGADHGMAMPPAWLAVLMLLAVVAIVAAAVRSALAGPDRRPSVRIALACEVVMTAAMGYMAALTLLS